MSLGTFRGCRIQVAREDPHQEPSPRGPAEGWDPDASQESRAELLRLSALQADATARQVPCN